MRRIWRDLCAQDEKNLNPFVVKKRKWQNTMIKGLNNYCNADK